MGLPWEVWGVIAIVLIIFLSNPRKNGYLALAIGAAIGGVLLLGRTKAIQKLVGRWLWGQTEQERELQEAIGRQKEQIAKLKKKKQKTSSAAIDLDIAIDSQKEALKKTKEQLTEIQTQEYQDIIGEWNARH